MFAPPSNQTKDHDAAERSEVAHEGKETSEYNPVWQSLATLGLQTKLTVSQPGDPYEQEADRVADRVMRMAAPPSHADQLSFSSFNPGTVQRKCNECEEEEKNLQRKEAVGPVAPASPSVNRTLASSGRPLDSSSRTFFEPRFGRDFSNVRIHTDATAADSAHAVSALAYTVGHNIVFGAGQYSPSTGSGQRLLAHELSHVCQQTNGLLMRAPDPAALADFNSRATALKNHKVYKRLDVNAKREVEEILTEARKRDTALDLMRKLEQLFSTPEKDPAKQAEETSYETEEAATRQEERMKDEGNKARVGAEEAITSDPKRVFKPAKGLNGKIFQIDARDPTDIAIYVKVQLVRAGARTKEEEVVRVKSLQDAIEKHIATIGYSVDLDFVDKPGPDVFTVDVNVEKWVVATNWVGDEVGLAHELHHLLGLKEDRYDYIEVHTTNEGMKFPDRIHWFLKELRKGIDNNEKSMMSSGNFLPLDDDICMVAGFSTKADVQACVEKRTAARRGKIAPGLVRAINLASKAHAVLGNILPGSRYDKPEQGEPTIGELRQRLALSRAETIFGKPITLDRALQIVGALRGELMMDNLFLVSELTLGCDVSHAISGEMASPRIFLCPSFFRVSVEEQARTLLLESVRRAGVGRTGLGNECATAGCDADCGDETQPQAWVRYVECLQDV